MQRSFVSCVLFVFFECGASSRVDTTGFSHEFDHLAAPLRNGGVVVKGFAVVNITPKLLESRPPLHDQETLWAYRNSYLSRLRQIMTPQLENADVSLANSISVTPGHSVHLQISQADSSLVWSSAWNSTFRVGHCMHNYILALRCSLQHEPTRACTDAFRPTRPTRGWSIGLECPLSSNPRGWMRARSAIERPSYCDCKLASRYPGDCLSFVRVYSFISCTLLTCAFVGRLQATLLIFFLTRCPFYFTLRGSVPLQRHGLAF